MDDLDPPMFDGLDRRDGPLQWHIADRERIMGIVTDTAPILMVYWSRDLVCQYSNKAFAEWFGRTVEDIAGIRYETLLGPVMAVANKPFIDGVLAGKPQQFEQVLLSPTHGRVATLTHYVPDVVGGEVVGFCAHVTDVSLLKETEQALLEEAAERQRANGIIRAGALALEESQRLGQIGSWVWMTAPDQIVWTKELYRIMGRDPDRPPPTFLQHEEMFAPDSWATLRSVANVALERGDPYRVDLEYVRAEGDRGWCEARGEAIRDAAGQIIGLRGTVRNMTPDPAPG